MPAAHLHKLQVFEHKDSFLLYFSKQICLLSSALLYTKSYNYVMYAHERQRHLHTHMYVQVHVHTNRALSLTY